MSQFDLSSPRFVKQARRAQRLQRSASAAPPFGERVARAWRALRGVPEQRSAIFRGAEVSRLTADWFARCMSPDDEIRGDLKLLRARGREQSRNDPLVHNFIDMCLVNVLGARGPKLQAQVRTANGDLDRRVNAIIEEGFNRWAAGRVSVDGKLTLLGFERLQFKTAAREGESFTRKIVGPNRPHGLALQGVDPDLVDETHHLVIRPGELEVRLGVEIDGDGAPMGYWIWDAPYQPGSIGRGRYRIEASEILHLFVSDRVNQMRGVSWVAPVMLALNHLNLYTEAELVASRAGAAKMGFVIQKDASNATIDDGTKPQEIDASPGTIERLAPGEEFQSWTPDHPSTAFSDFVKNITRRVATGLGVSYNSLANDLEGVNFSSMRHGMQQEREIWRMLQDWWITDFRQPVFEAWLQTAILSGALPLDSRDWRRYTAVRWIPRGWPWIDPVKDMEATQLGIQNGLTSRTRALAEIGEDYEEILEELAHEAELAKAAGVDISGPAPAAGGPAKSAADAPADGGDGGGGGDGAGDGGDAPAKRNGVRPRAAVRSALGAGGR